MDVCFSYTKLSGVLSSHSKLRRASRTHLLIWPSAHCKDVDLIVQAGSPPPHLHSHPWEGVMRRACARPPRAGPWKSHTSRSHPIGQAYPQGHAQWAKRLGNFSFILGGYLLRCNLGFCYCTEQKVDLGKQLVISATVLTFWKGSCCG